MAKSGLSSSIHSFECSKPENTRFQYGSSVCLLSIAAPIAGTCDEPTPATILATPRPRFLAAIAFDRAAAGGHHGAVVLLGGPGHQRGEMAEGMAVGRPEFGGEVDVAAELQHAIVV